MTIFREFLPLYCIFQKTNLISFSYLPRPSNWQSMSKIDFSTVATISLIFSDNYGVRRSSQRLYNNLILSMQTWFFETQTWFSETQTWFFETQTWFFETQTWFFETQTWISETQTWFFETQTWFFETQTWFSETQTWFFETQTWFFETQTWISETQTWFFETQTFNFIRLRIWGRGKRASKIHARDSEEMWRLARVLRVPRVCVYFNSSPSFCSNYRPLAVYNFTVVLELFFLFLFAVVVFFIFVWGLSRKRQLKDNNDCF